MPGALLDVSPALVARFGASRRVHTVRYSTAATMTALVDDIAAQLAAAGIERAGVLGSSYGGWVAQCLVRRHPRLARRLILVHTFALRATDATRFRIGLALWRFMPADWMRKLGSKRVRRLIRPIQGASPEDFRRLEANLVAVMASPATLELLHRQNLCMLESCTAFLAAPGDLAHHDGRILIIESTTTGDPPRRPCPPARNVSDRRGAHLPRHRSRHRARRPRGVLRRRRVVPRRNRGRNRAAVGTSVRATAPAATC